MTHIKLEVLNSTSAVTIEPQVMGWPEAYAAGPEISGGKGYNLGRLHRYGFRIPRGGVIPASWYAELLGLVPQDALAFLRAVPAESVAEPMVLAALREIQAAFESMNLPAPLANSLDAFFEAQGLTWATVSIRSSATTEDGARASFAGIHHSFLNVSGSAAIQQAILGCYASLWTPQALAYRRKMNFGDSEVLCAVVICEMVYTEGREEPESAGVAFSFDPLTGRRDQIVIDAAPGLGEAVVSGAVDPQRIVYRNTRRGLWAHSHTAGTPLLPPAKERELAHQVWRMHWAFGDGQDPQDVEWAYDGKDLWFLQVRPATNVRRFLPVPGNLPRHWSTANIKDAVPGVVCTMSWSLLKDIVETVAFAGPIAAGYPLESGVELIRRFRGRGYFELTWMQWVLYDALGVTPAQLVESIGGHQPEIPVPGDPMKGPDGRRRAMMALRLMRRIWGIERALDRALIKREERMRSVATLDLAHLTRRSLMSVVEQFRLDNDSLDIVMGLSNSAGTPWEQALVTMLKPGFGDQAQAMTGKLCAGTGAVTSAEHGYAIYDLAVTARGDAAAHEWLGQNHPATEWKSLPADSPFRAGLERFLQQYGHRAVYEADYLNPRWAEDPTYILDQVRFFLANPPAVSPREAAKKVREGTEKSVREKAGWRSPIVFWLVARLRRAMAARERAKSSIAAMSPHWKRVTLEIARRISAAGHLDDPRQVFDFCTADLFCWLEGWWDGTGAKELTADRARQREMWLAQEAPPDVISEESNGRVVAMPQVSARTGESWKGIGAAPGRARGVARIIRHPSEGHVLQAGEVLVAPSTDPGWTPLFLRASAIVMESGGFLSHGAIVAREYGIPAVVNLPGILSELRTGDSLSIDGDSGLVVRES